VDKKTNMNFFPPRSVKECFRALCPPEGKPGEIVSIDGKRYFLASHEGLIFIKRIKKQ
jgi:hypothetical protein